MSGGKACACGKKDHWTVLQRNGNSSAFNGGRWQRSDYSAVRCMACSATWRTKAPYVKTLMDYPSYPASPIREGKVSNEKG
jgi:hypothetical protein